LNFVKFEKNTLNDPSSEIIIFFAKDLIKIIRNIIKNNFILLNNNITVGTQKILKTK